MSDLILNSARLAKQWHAGQVRKYHRQPYIVHPARVAARVMLIEGVTPEEVAAAWLHDVIEDTDCTANDLGAAEIPEKTITLVNELTNPSKSQSGMRRVERKKLDHKHLAGVSDEAKRIKLIDRTDNLYDMNLADDAFKSLFAAESVELTRCLAGVDDELLEELFAAIESLGFPRDYQI